jgi:GTP-binding protein
MVSCESENPAAEYAMLLEELKKYNPELLAKDRVLALTKADLLPEKESKELLSKLNLDIPVLCISAHTGYGIAKLKDLLWEVLHR